MLNYKGINHNLQRCSIRHARHTLHAIYPSQCYLYSISELHDVTLQLTMFKNISQKQRWIFPLISLIKTHQKAVFCPKVSCPQIEVEQYYVHPLAQILDRLTEMLINCILLLFHFCQCTEHGFRNQVCCASSEIPSQNSDLRGISVKSSYWELRISNFRVQMEYTLCRTCEYAMGHTYNIIL